MIDGREPDTNADPMNETPRHDEDTTARPTPQDNKKSRSDGDKIAELGDELGGPA